MSFGATMRLNYKGITIFAVVAFCTYTLFDILFRSFGITGTPLELLNFSLTVVIVLLMLFDPIVKWWEEPRIEVSFIKAQFTEVLGAKPRKPEEESFSFSVTNTGRSAAADTRIEFRILSLSKYDPDKPRTGLKGGWVITDHKSLAPLVSRDEWLGFKVAFQIAHKLSSGEIAIAWPVEKQEGANITPDVEERGPIECYSALFLVDVSWAFKGEVEHKAFPFYFNTKEDGSAEITERSLF